MKEGLFRRIAPAFSNKLHPFSVLVNRSNDEVILLKPFFDGFKMPLGKEKNLRIAALYVDYLTPLKVILNPSQKRLSNITSSLL